MENDGEPFDVMLGKYISHGHVWSSPTEFMLFAKVRVEAGEFAEGKPNAWYIQLVGGESPFARLLRILPEPMEMICWHRGPGRLHVWPWNKFNRLRKEV